MLNSRTVSWIKNLASQECSIHAGERSSFDISLTRDAVLSTETLLFVHDLYTQIEHSIDIFNRECVLEDLKIKMSSPAHRFYSFALMRNSMRLNITSYQAGTIQFQCEKNWTENIENTLKTSLMFSGLVEAKFGAFDEIQWLSLGVVVSAEQVARNYLSEFIQLSRPLSQSLQNGRK